MASKMKEIRREKLTAGMSKQWKQRTVVFVVHRSLSFTLPSSSCSDIMKMRKEGEQGFYLILCNKTSDNYLFSFRQHHHHHPQTSSLFPNLIFFPFTSPQLLLARDVNKEIGLHSLSQSLFHFPTLSSTHSLSCTLLIPWYTSNSATSKQN